MKGFRAAALIGCALVIVQGSAARARAAVPAAIAAAVASPRPAADTARDGLRKPAAVLALSGIKPGDKVGDFMPGTGYFTRLFSAVVGSAGHVYALVPAELAAKAPKIQAAMTALAAEPAYKNVTLIVAPTARTSAPEKLDLVWTSQNYHDLYGFFGADAAAQADRAVFQALKPGGRFVVIDHVANTGTATTSPTTLHRIEPAVVKAQVLAAGFTLVATNDVLRNPADPHTAKVFDPAIRGHTDQFMMVFQKPAS